VGEDLSLPVLVTRIAGSEKVWRAVVTYYKEVLLQKEAAERIRRQEAAAAEAAAAETGCTYQQRGERDGGGRHRRGRFIAPLLSSAPRLAEQKACVCEGTSFFHGGR